MKNRTNKILEFLKEIGKLKKVEREIFLETKKESSAEHSWHLAMFIMLFEKDLPNKLNFNRMLKMSLMHDLVEIYAGDTYLFDEEGRKDKKEREEKAAEKLFSQLPEDLEKEFHELFQEYENNETKEAKIVKSFNHIHPILENIEYNGIGWEFHRTKYEDIEKAKRHLMEHDPFILEIYEKLMKEAKDKKLL